MKELAADAAHLARIVTVNRDRYVISSPLGTIPAEATGKLLYCIDAAEDLPCVGDWAAVEYLDNQEHAIIHDVLPRKTILRRRAPDGASTYQPIAANIDVAYVVQSCDVDFSLNRLDRYVVMATDGGITSRLLLTKCDLVDDARTAHIVDEVRKEHGIDVIAISSATGAGYDRFVHALEKSRTYCLLGSSGVGKSTILNKLLGTEALPVGAVREQDGRGRHTTTSRQLIMLESGALFVDTPGMRELGMMAFGSGIEESFQDIAATARQCRFPNCTHTVEAGCAILAKVGTGELSTARYPAT